MNVEEIKKVTSELADTMTQLKSKLDAQEKLQKEHGDRDEKLITDIDKLTKRYDEQHEAFTSFTKRVEDLETRLNRPGAASPGTRQAIKTLGDVFVESPQYKQMLANQEFKCSPVEVGPQWATQKKTLGADTSSGVGAGAGLVTNFHRPDVVSPAVEGPTVMSLIPQLYLAEHGIEYAREKNIYQLYAVLTVAAIATDTVLNVDNASGFYPGQVIDVGGEARTIDAAGVDLDAKTITITAGLTGGHAIGVAVTSTTFAFTKEAYLKPLAEVEIELLTSSARTLAVMMAATKQLLSDSRQAAQYLNLRLPEIARVSMEQQLLYGAGGTTELDGIMNTTGINALSWSAGVVGDTQLDVIRKAATLVGKSNYAATGVVLYHDEWQAIELLKGSDGHYIWASVTQGGQQILWRVPVAVSGQMATGYGLIGSFRMGCTYWDREQASIRTSDSHKDWFGSNKVAVLFEQRGTLTVERPKAFTKITFDSAPT